MKTENLKNEIQNKLATNYHMLISGRNGNRTAVRELITPKITIDFGNENNGFVVSIPNVALGGPAGQALQEAIKQTAIQLFGRYVSPEPDFITHSARSFPNNHNSLEEPGTLRWRHHFDSIQ